jgi:hypothetical protein
MVLPHSDWPWMWIRPRRRGRDFVGVTLAMTVSAADVGQAHDEATGP